MASVGEHGLARLWDVATGKELFKTQKHKERTHGVVCAPDGHTFASAGGDGTVRIWDVASGEELLIFETTTRTRNAHAVAYSPDGKRLASGTLNTIRIWNLETGVEPTLIEGASRELFSLHFHRQGRRISRIRSSDRF